MTFLAAILLCACPEVLSLCSLQAQRVPVGTGRTFSLCPLSLVFIHEWCVCVWLSKYDIWYKVSQSYVCGDKMSVDPFWAFGVTKVTRGQSGFLGLLWLRR